MAKASKVFILEEAQTEILKTLEYYESISIELLEDLQEKIQEAIREIARRPKAHPPLRQFRKINLKRFPYKIVFRLEGKEIHVVAFAHHKRKPSYWKKR